MTRKETIHPLDEEFAAAADEFFAGTLQKTEREDAELSALLDTLHRVDDAFVENAETEARERIRRNLRKAWFAEQELKAAKRPGFQDRIRDFFWQNRQQAGLAFSFAMILLVLAVTPFLVGTDPGMAGTAGGLNPAKTSVMAILLIVFVSALVWALKRKQ